MAIRFFGEVERLYVDSAGCYIRLQNATSSPANDPFPKDGYFQIRSDHANYDSLYSLAMLASSGRHRLQIRTSTAATAAERARVSYLVLDW